MAKLVYKKYGFTSELRDVAGSILALSILFVPCIITAQTGKAQTFTVIHNFTGGNDGGTPYAGLTIDREGDLFGTAAKGGIGYGTAYKLKQLRDGWILTPIYSFAGGNDGAGPAARVVIGPNSNLYGTTIGGGGGSGGCMNFLQYGGCGTVFRLRPQPTTCRTTLCPWVESVLYRFSGGSDGAAPWLGDLTFDGAGDVYGTASAGGENGNGCTGGCGVVFELTPSQGGWAENVLHSFTGQPDGYTPYAGVAFDNAGNLYGTTSAGGASNNGTIFDLTPSGPGWTENILYDFQGATDGGNPVAGITVGGSGNFYGATNHGGTSGGGTAFQLTNSDGSWTYTVVNALNGGSEGPVTSLVSDSAGNLYGTTWSDGAFGYGSVFKLVYSGGTWAYSSLHDFTGGSDGGNPSSSLVLDSSGNVYGTASVGGTNGAGVVFEITPIGPGPAFPIKSSASSRYLVDQNDAPFLLVGDSPHAMFTNISLEDANAYLQDRASHGITALWCELLVNGYVGGQQNGATYDGIVPFTGTLPGGDYNLTTPNPEYFARVDAMINLAASYNIVILLDSFETGGWMTTFEANGNANANSWGQYIGNRYKDFPNIIWIMGNDFQTWNTSNTDNMLAQNVMQGVASADTSHMQTTELNYYISESLEDSLLIPYTRVAGAYTYYPTYYEVLQEYDSNAATVPAFLEEGFYDGVTTLGQTPTTLMLRKQAYWTVLAGGLAGYMGGTRYYSFQSGWQTGIDDTAAAQLTYFGSFIQSYAWYNLVPDQTHTVVTAGYGIESGNGSGSIQTDAYVTAARDPDGSLVVAYCPESATITVDMTKLQGLVTARWFDPTAAAYTTIGTFSNSGLQNFTTPGNNRGGDPDWVLVLSSN